MLGTMLSLCLAQAEDALARGADGHGRPARVAAAHHGTGPAARHRAPSRAAHKSLAAAPRRARVQPGRAARAATVRHAREQHGRASIYSRRFTGRRMADGGRFDPRSDSAASRTLPLGTRARVTNLRNGRTAIVQVRDRGPHTGGRILDVSPGTAERLGMAEAGIAPIRIVALSPVAEAAPAPAASARASAAHISSSRARSARASSGRAATTRRTVHGRPGRY
ncbi:septal ring lytic transglycosylase RlpA family protein [Roseomonas elaeocarpi]|uniref:Endolytic peptidoglycan transglycosylase RlpA n=1 Tax=Roseomonas elaeocarpi TaxID=907779 RepID=A0ABV6JX95_9PROT